VSYSIVFHVKLPYPGAIGRYRSGSLINGKPKMCRMALKKDKSEKNLMVLESKLNIFMSNERKHNSFIINVGKN
jgi:hypothetical protein